jgi:ABC-type nitrate/sulfonate/bicarbonate transport system substrate-binding protein
LKGKIGGVHRLGTTSDRTLRRALRRFGIDPEKETKIDAPHDSTTNEEEIEAPIGKNLTTSDVEGVERAYRARTPPFPKSPLPIPRA